MKQLKLNRALIIIFTMQIIQSCQQKNEEIPARSFPLIISEARFQPISLDSVNDLMVVPVNKDKVRRFRAEKAVNIQIANNMIWPSSSKITPAKQPNICTPGTEGFLKPQNIRVFEKPIPSGMPDPFTPKEMDTKTPNPFTFASWGKLHGLKSETVTDLLQDKLDNIWICTSRGVTRYDGKSFSNFTTEQGLVYNDVRSVFQDSKGNIWFGTNGGGVSKYDGYSFTNFTVSDGLVSNYVVSGMVEDSLGNIWMATWGGLSKYDGHSFINYTHRNGLVHPTVETILKDKAGNIWLGTKGGLSKFNGISFTNYTRAEGLSSNAVISLLEDKKGQIWLGTPDGGISIFNGNSFEHLTLKEGLINDQVNSLIEDKEGNIWIGTGDGLIKYNGKWFLNFTEKEGLTNDNIFCLLEDNSGKVWVGTGSGGVLKYNSHSFTHLTQSEGLKKNYVFSLFEDKKGDLWAGTWRGGISIYDGTKLKVITGDQKLFQNEVKSICQDKDGNFWFAVYKGVAKYDGESFSYFTEDEGLVHEDVNYIMEDSLGALWFGTDDGVSKYTGNSFTNLFHHGKEAKKIYAVTQDQKGNIWFCTSAGILRYDGYRFDQLTSTDNSLQASFNCMYEDPSGILWFGCDKGLVKYDGHNLTRLTEEEGLVNNVVMSITQDDLGNLWLGTNNGLSKLSPDKSAFLSGRVKSGQIREDDIFFSNYTYSDGFLGVGANINAMIKASTGTIYVGTNNGITYFDPAQDEPKSNPFNIQITAIRISNQTIDWSGLKQKPDSSFLLNNAVIFQNFSFDTLSRWYGVPNNLNLDYENNSLSFDFVAITTDQPQNIKYQFQLVGLDKTKSVLTTYSTASYGNLSPGKYTFKVRAMNYRGDWSNEYSYVFTIRPPWWQTFWFRTFALIAFAVAVYFVSRSVSRYQLRKKQRLLENELLLQNERQRISSDLHDEIGSTLSSISIYTGLAKKETNKDLYLDSISTNVNEVVGKLDDLVWRINPKYDTIGSVIYRIMAYAEPLANSKKIFFSVQEDADSKTQKFSADTKHHLYMILKELVNNAVKHSGCDSIKISFFRQSGYLQISVADNGKGFDPATSNMQRNGLENIKHRIHSVNGSLTINSGNDGGVNISIRIPLV
ncbi:sensor histidine kinase [Flavitalea sp.]